MKYSFLNDYSEGAHPLILETLLKTNLSQQAGYGNDALSLRAVAKIREACKNEAVEVHFVAGGTLANLLVAGALLKPYESVISAESGHINTHEAGAIEATGHKIEYVKSQDGKLTVSDISRMLMKFPKYHTVKPRMVYLSNTTELGTVYTKAELEDIYRYCSKNDLLVFIDGARLPMALVASGMSLAELSRLCDVFYIGGTKCGALMGEAIVITNPALQPDFRYNVKQRGAMLAKGRVLGAQFDALFTGDLIFRLARHANAMAAKMAGAFQELGYTFLTPAESNQVFPVMAHRHIKKLAQKYEFFEWEELDQEHSALRLVTSWATEEKMVDKFIADLKKLKADGGHLNR